MIIKDPRICQCGCDAFSKQTTFLIISFRERMKELITQYTNNPSQNCQAAMAEIATILIYLEGLQKT